MIRFGELDFNFKGRGRTLIALELMYILRPSLIDYINGAKIWTIRQVGGNAFTVEKKGWEWVGGGTSVFL